MPFDSCRPLLLTRGLQCLLSTINGNLSPSDFVLFVMLVLESRLTAFFFSLRALFWRMRPVAHDCYHLDRNWMASSELIMINFKDFSLKHVKIFNGKVELYWYSSDGESACQCRGHGFNPWSRKIPHAVGQAGPHTTTPEAHAPRARALQQEKTPQWAACTLQLENTCHN